MKKYTIIILVFLFCISALIACLFFNNKLSIEQSDNVVLRFNYQGVSINNHLSENDSKQIIKLLNKKRLYSRLSMGELSCGFTRDVAFRIGEDYYEIACDGCGYVYCEADKKYLELNKTETEFIHSFFENQGGFFPCV